MARRGGFADVVSEGINGYIRGMGIQHGLDREKKEDEWREEQRANQRTDRQRADEERSVLRGAYEPAQEGAGGMTKPITADNRDVGLPGEPGAVAGGLIPGAIGAAGQSVDPATYNTDAAGDARAIAGYKKIGKPMEAAQLSSANTTAKAAQFKLDRDMETHVNEKADQLAMTITTPEQVKSFLSGSPLVGGKEVSIVTSQDGKKFQMMVPGPDGNMVKFGQEIGTDPKEIQKVVAMQFTHMKPAEKVAVLQHAETLAEQQRQFEETKKLQREQLGEQQRHNKSVEGISGATLGIHRDAQRLAREKFEADLKNDPMRNLPPVVKGQVARLDSPLKMIDKAIIDAQSKNEWDPTSKGGKELLAQRAALTGQINTLVKPYMEAAPGAGKAPSYSEYIGGGNAGAAPKSAAGKAMKAVENDPKYAGTITVGPQGTVTPGAAAVGAPAVGADPVQAKYDEWQAAKQAWYKQPTPTSAAREKQLEAEYTQMIQNPR